MGVVGWEREFPLVLFLPENEIRQLPPTSLSLSPLQFPMACSAKFPKLQDIKPTKDLKLLLNEKIFTLCQYYQVVCIKTAITNL